MIHESDSFTDLEPFDVPSKLNDVTTRFMASCLWESATLILLVSQTHANVGMT